MIDCIQVDTQCQGRDLRGLALEMTGPQHVRQSRVALLRVRVDQPVRRFCHG
jgi:hypothetical protein